MPARRAPLRSFAPLALLAIAALAPRIARASDQDLERARVLDQVPRPRSKTVIIGQPPK